MEHSQYPHFPSRVCEGVDDVVLPAEDRDCIRCFANQVKLTRALFLDLDEAVKEIQQLGNHGEEASQKITELETLCKQKEDAAKKLKEEKANLERTIQSHDERIMEMADEYGLNHIGENDDDEDDNDGRDVVAPPDATPLAVAPEVIIVEEWEDPMEMVPGTGGP
jgi:septal ring factor EnvC (AmiA/AmiB activator)